MRDNGRSDNGPELQPGQIWLIEQPAAERLCTLDSGAFEVDERFGLESSIHK